MRELNIKIQNDQENERQIKHENKLKLKSELD